MNPDERLRQLLAELEQPEARTRRLAASYLSDWIEARAVDAFLLSDIVQKLLEVGLAEKDEWAKECMFFALAGACKSGVLPKLSWYRLGIALRTLPVSCLEHALVILGYSGQPKYRTVIQSFLSHPSHDIQETAQYALQLLSAPEEEAGDADPSNSCSSR